MQTLDNAPLISNNNNLINTDSNQDENANLENDHIKVGSQEKICIYREDIKYGIEYALYLE